MASEDIKSNEYWRDKLTAEEYAVCREKGTERAFTGEYWDAKTAGDYRCRCCGELLFSSQGKFDSGCGWPSFTEPSHKSNVDEHTDRSHGMVRTEVTCSHCDSHLGHVFTDGPGPTGLRYCINSLSVKLEEEG